MKSIIHRVIQNESGLSLTGVLISAGLLGMIAIGVSKIMDQGFKNSADLSSRQEARDLRDEFYASVKKEACGLVPPGDSVSSKNLLLNAWAAPSATLALDTLYGPYGQEFKAKAKYGKISIAEDSPFLITAPSRKSPLVQGLPDTAKTAGEYYEMNSKSKIVAELTINLKNSKAAGFVAMPPMKFMLLLTIDPASNLITDCQSIAEVSAGKEACNGMGSPDGAIVFSWNENTLHCDVTVNTGGGAAGVLGPDEPGDVDPALYVLSSIP